ncbi:MAG: hypothetical protein VB913_05325 [Rhodospirillales bacterium]|jgi:hypothetical protein
MTNKSQNSSSSVWSEDQITISSEEIQSAIHKAHQLRGQTFRNAYRSLVELFADLRLILGPIPSAFTKTNGR